MRSNIHKAIRQPYFESDMVCLRKIWWQVLQSQAINALRQRLTPNGAMQQTLDPAAERGYATT